MVKILHKIFFCEFRVFFYSLQSFTVFFLQMCNLMEFYSFLQILKYGGKKITEKN